MSPSEQAQALLEGRAAWPAAPDAALAWALKEACYAAWSTDPRAAAHAADELNAAMARWQAGGVAVPDEVAALAAWTRGIAHLTRGQMAEAITALDTAAAAFGAAAEPGPAAQTQVPKIMALAMLGRHTEAAACAEATQAALVAVGDWRTAAKVSLNQGSLHLRHDAYARAAQHYREAARLFARVRDHEHSVMADIGHADALAALGELDEASHLYSRAGVRAQAHALPVLQALVDESVALLALSRGRYGEALAGFERARAAYERLAMPQHLAIAEKQLADAYLAVRLLPEAEALYAQAAAQFTALDMPDDTAWTLAQWGRALALAGRTGEAQERLSRAQALFDAQGNGAGQATVALARAEWALHSGSPSALALSEAAVAAHAEAGSDDGRARAALAHAQALAAAGLHGEAHAAFTRTLAESRAQARLAVEARSLAGLAAADLALGHDEAAREGFGAAAERLDDLRQALPADELRNALLADHLQPHRALLALAVRDHARAPSPAHAAAVLQALDRVRARSLSERLAAGAPPAEDDDATTLALRARVSWLARRAQGLEEDDDTPSVVLRTELQAAEQALLERVRRQRLSQPSGPTAVMAPLDTAALQAALAPGDALVAYGESEGQLLACVVRHDALSVHPALGGWATTVQAVQDARFQIDTLGRGAAVGLQAHLPMLTRRCAARLQAVHTLLWAPLAGALHGARRVLLVAPAPLGALPFAAWAGDVELAWAPSAASAIAALTPRPTAAGAAGQALVLGEPHRLPQAADEAREVASAHPTATLQLGSAATVAALQQAARGAAVIHLACHATFRADSPRFSALHLHDGALTAEQVETLALDAAPTVVLSACETAGEAAHQGDEWLGLVRAFLVAGAARVVASLWPVDDAATRTFMAHFHRALAQGFPPAAALAAAQAALRASHPHPFYWAAFALYGGW